MRVSCRALADVPDAAYARLTGDSFFASRGFLDLWRAKGGRPVAWTVEADGALAAVLPGVEYGRGPYTRLACMPDGCYGRLFVDPTLEPERAAVARELFDALARRHYAKVHIFDFHGTALRPAGFAVASCETSLADITGPEWWPPDAKLRSQIRKSVREGIRVERFDWERHAAAFLALSAAAARRHGLAPRYPPAFYRALAGLARRDARVMWAWCAHGGRPACSHIYFLEGATLQAWQTCFDRTFSFLKPNQYIRFALAREAERRGAVWLNLGATPEEAPGLAYYKARWGGRRVSYASYVRKQGLGLVADAALARRARAMAPGAARPWAPEPVTTEPVPGPVAAPMATRVSRRPGGWG